MGQEQARDGAGHGEELRRLAAETAVGIDQWFRDARRALQLAVTCLQSAVTTDVVQKPSRYAYNEYRARSCTCQ
jgi:hypothetical protein